MKLRLSIGMVWGLMIFMCWGCVSSPDIVSTDKQAGTVYSTAETRAVTVDQPFLLSGDFFRQRGILDKEDTVRFRPLEPGETASAPDSKALEKKVNLLEKEVARLRLSSQAPAPTPTPALKPKDRKAASVKKERIVEQGEGALALKVKAGLLMDATRIDPSDALQLSETAERLAKEMPLFLINDQEIHEILSWNNALENKDLYRTSGILTLYPGIRMLVLVERFRLPAALPGTAVALVSIVDAGLFHRYRPMQIEMPVQTQGDKEKFVTSVVSAALTRAVTLSETTPWFCRVFSNEDHLFYLNAGRETGLKEGMRLKITAAGTQIKSPGGLPAGWIPGRELGVLEIARFFGKDFSVCTLVQGKAPTAHDYCVLEEQP